MGHISLQMASIVIFEHMLDIMDIMLLNIWIL